MELSRELRLQLVESVSDYLGDSPSTVSRWLLGATAMVKAPGAGTNTERFARWVVTYVLNQRTPKLFVRVVEETTGGALVELHAIVAALQADPGKWAAPVAAGLWVPDGWPFIDRSTVRETLAQMAAGDGPAALAIEGPFGYGKRTVSQYIRWLAGDTGSFNPAIVELRREPQPGLLTKMVFELATAVGTVPDLTTTHKEPERQATVLARQLAVASADAPATAWLVANVVDDSGLEEGVLTFVDELLDLLAQAPALADNLRVLVFCDELVRLELKHAPPVEARHTLAQVTDAEIREWFEAAAPGKSPVLYNITADTVVAALSAADHPESVRLRIVSSSCAAAQRKLAAMRDE